MSRDQLRDYVYVSRLKVARLSDSITPKRRFRVSRLDIGFGGAGGSFDIAPSEHPNLVSAIPTLEAAIDEKYGIRHVADPALASGHWCMTDGMTMACEIDQNWDCVVFFGEQNDGTRVILGGSTGHLLDRSPPERAGHQLSSSTYRGLVAALSHLFEGQAAMDRHALDGYGSPTLDDEAVDLKEGVSQLRQFNMSAHSYTELPLFMGLLWRRAPVFEPMSFLARVFDVFDDRGTRYVLGTPLYVANQPPD